jgi:hypothetical protein
MLEKWKRSWKAFRNAPPGKRFLARHQTREDSGSPAGRVAAVALGLVLILVGAVLLVIPGPGLIVIAFGAALVAQEFLWMAKALDRLELGLRRWYRAGRRFWKSASTAARAALAAGAALGVAGAGYVAYLWLLRG